MFNRSRRKIIAAITGSLVLLLAVTLAVILFASYQEIGNRNAEMLGRYIESYVPGQPPGRQGRPDGEPRGDEPPRGMRRDFALSTFYSVALDKDGEVLAVDDGGKDLYDEDELAEMAEELADEDRSSGRTDTLIYAVVDKGTYTLVAFMDNSVTDNGMSTMARYVLIVGGAAVVVLFLISLVLSRRIIRPLEENDRAQKQFISDAGHELKTPVSVIGANAEMLSRQIGENEWLSNIQYENERMGGLIRELLDLSRAENAELPMEEADLSRIVTGEALAFESLAFERGRMIRNEIEDGIRLKGDPAQLARLVSVLLDNAVRHSSGGSIDVSLRRQAHEALLEVINEGEAIPPEKMEHLFDRFYRVDEARSGEEQHYGLGLAIAKAIAERHGGHIGASCRDGKVRFAVFLPFGK